MFNRIREPLARSLHQAGSTVGHASQEGVKEVEQSLREGWRRAGSLIAAYPLASLAAAAALGIALGWWVKRR